MGSEVVILATPIWWSNQSSLIRRVVERLDDLHDKVMAGEPSLLAGKVGGIVITGDSDGAQHVIANLCNFFTAHPAVRDALRALGAPSERQGAHQGRSARQVRICTADKMIRQLLKYVPT